MVEIFSRCESHTHNNLTKTLGMQFYFGENGLTNYLGHALPWTDEPSFVYTGQPMARKVCEE